MAFFCPGAAHGTARKKSTGSKPVSLSQGTSPITPGPSSLSSEKGSEGGGGGEKQNNDITITLPHSKTQSMIKKLIVIQKYEPKPGEKGLAVSRGETVLLVRDDGDWMYVRNESGAEGFVPRSHLLSPSRTRTRTSSRNGTALRHVASNGCVEVHSTAKHETTTALSQDEGHHNHVTSNGHHHHHHPSPRVTANEILYDRKMYSPSPSSGVASLADQFSPGSGPAHSPNQDRGRDREEVGRGGGGGGREHAQSSNSSLDNSRESCSSYEQDPASHQHDHHHHPHHRGPALISPLNHINETQDNFHRGGGGSENMDGIPRSNSSSSRSTGDSASARQTPLLNGVHYIDKTTNHIYSTLEQPTSPPPPPLPPRNAAPAPPGFSASQEPEPNVYSQLEQGAPGINGGTTCSQEALVHPSHHHNSFSEGWTRDGKTLGYPSRSASAKARVYKEVVEIRRNSGSPRGGRQRIVPPPPLRVSSVAGGTRSSDQEQHVLRHQRRQQNWNHNETKITKFRKTVWGVFLVTHDFDPLDENEIAIRKGEHVSVWNQDDRDWFWVVKHASSGQEEGFVPSGCLREVSTDSKVPSIISGSACHTPTAATPVGGNSLRLDDIDPMRHRTHSQESRHSNSTHQPHPSQPRPSSGGMTRPGSTRERRSSESGPHVHRVHANRDPPLSLTDEPLPPGPPSSPPPPYTEFDTNSRRFVSLSQQPGDVHSQPVGGYISSGMHRTRSQGYVTSRNRVVHHYPPPNSPSSPCGAGGGGTLV